jgi:hypothetical protein
MNVGCVQTPKAAATLPIFSVHVHALSMHFNYPRRYACHLRQQIRSKDDRT